MQTLAEIAACFAIYAVCEPCQRVASTGVEGGARDNGADYPIDRLRMRIFCHQCNKRTQALRIVYVGPQGRASGFRYQRG